MESDPHYTVLTTLEAQIVLATTESGKATKSVEPWLTDQCDIDAVYYALSNNSTVAYLPSLGKEFVIKHKPHSDHFFLKPVRGFVPCGWFKCLNMT